MIARQFQSISLVQVRKNTFRETKRICVLSGGAGFFGIGSWRRLAGVAGLGVLLSGALHASQPDQKELQQRFEGTVRPFVETYCITCHGKVKPEGDMDLSADATFEAAERDQEHWKLALEKLQAGEMPPEKAKLHPAPEKAQEVVAWVQALRRFEAQKNAGDPGIVLARRLSNAEYDYTIRDLTGVDMRPTREFPVDPANTAGFDNSGESLTMSPALLKKYLKAARDVAGHMFLKPQGFAFAPYPMLAETDRDKYCVGQIIEFYHRQNTNYADYFQAAWRFKNRAAARRAQGDAGGNCGGKEREREISCDRVAIPGRAAGRAGAGPKAANAVARVAETGREGTGRGAARVRENAGLCCTVAEKG